MNHYPRHIGDWMRDTAHLSEVEECVYSRMIDMYYSREKPLPVDTTAVCRLVRATSKEARVAVGTLLAEYFVLEDDGWHQKRCDAELARYAERSAKAAKSASARWGERSANAMRTHMPTHSECNANQEPIANNQEPSKSRERSSKLDAPSPEHADLAQSLGVDCKAEFSKYRDWMAANGRKQRDESAGFRNWLRKAAEFRRHGKQSARDAVAAQIFGATNERTDERVIDGEVQRVA